MATYYTTLPNQVPYHGEGYGSGYNSNGNPHAANSSSGFAFKKRFERINWKQIASIDVDSISRNLEFHTLQENIMNITFCNIEAEIDVRMMDPNFLKLFKLAQLTIEYLLHSQDYLSELVTGLEGKLKKAVEEHDVTKKALEKTSKEYSDLKKECHKRKKMLLAQQQLLQAGTNSYNKCPYCNKAFVNISFLQSHLARRHAEQTNMYNSIVGSQLQPPFTQSAPLKKETEQVNEQQLSATLPPQPSQPDPKILQELESIKERLRFTESQLDEEKHARSSELQKEKNERKRKEQEREEEINRWKEEQAEMQQGEIEHIRNMFMKELKEANEKYRATEAALEKLQRIQFSKNRSNLGEMQDDEEYNHALDQLNKQREEVAAMREQLLQQQVDAVKNHQVKQEPVIDRVQDITIQSDDDNDDIQNTYTKQLEEIKDVSPDRKDARNKMDPGSSDSEEEITEVGTGTLGTTQKSLPTTLGTTCSLSLSGTRNILLLEQLKKNPKVLEGMKKELIGVLEDRLEQRGISKTATGLTSNVFNNKITHLKTEREGIAKRHHSFYDIRQQYATQVEQLAYRKLQEQRKNQQLPPSPKASPMLSRPQSGRMNSAGRQGQQAGQQSPVVMRQKAPELQTPQQRPLSTPQGPNQPRLTTGQRPMSTPESPKMGIMKKPQPSRGEGSPTHGVPRPAPRAGSPEKQVRMSTTLSTTGQSYTSTGQSYTSGTGTGTASGTYTGSSQWEESDEESHSPSPTPRTRNKQPPQQQQKPKQQQQAQPQRQQQQQKQQRPQPQDDDDDESESDSDDWDEVSELDHVVDPAAPRGRPHHPGPAAPAPRGQNVATLSKSIEMQLAGRAGKKPAGGVNTVVQQDEEDSLVSITDEEEESPRPKPSARKMPSRASHQTDTDTNTYGTSVWDSHNRGSPGQDEDDDESWGSDLHTEDIK